MSSCQHCLQTTRFGCGCLPGPQKEVKPVGLRQCCSGACRCVVKWDRLWHDSCVRDTWLIHLCCSGACRCVVKWDRPWHDSFSCDTTHAYVPLCCSGACATATSQTSAICSQSRCRVLDVVYMSYICATCAICETWKTSQTCAIRELIRRRRVLYVLYARHSRRRRRVLYVNSYSYVSTHTYVSSYVVDVCYMWYMRDIANVMDVCCMLAHTS